MDGMSEIGFPQRSCGIVSGAAKASWFPVLLILGDLAVRFWGAAASLEWARTTI
jgi:hypothetical protein